MATSPQAAIACYPSLAMMGHSWVRVVRRICIPQCQARLWPGRTFHVKRRISLVHMIQSYRLEETQAMSDNGASTRVARDRGLEILSATLMALATLLSAWCAYQATRWDWDPFTVDTGRGVAHDRRVGARHHPARSRHHSPRNRAVIGPHQAG